MLINMSPQPDDETCGQTCLQAVYRYYDDEVALAQLVKTVIQVKTGGTIAANLALHALKRNYATTTYTYNLNLFDPTWFDEVTGESDNAYLLDKIIKQKKYFKSRRDIEASDAYIKMLKSGGKVCYRDLSYDFLETLFAQKKPIITGLSATYLYRTARERMNKQNKSVYDDIRGDPCGHFVVLSGFEKNKRKVIVADPLHSNPISQNNHYVVERTRLVNSIMLGVLTYDSNLLVISPKEQR
jgi:hypothetical protein